MGRLAFLLAVAAHGLACRTDGTGQLEANKALVLHAHSEVCSGGDMEAATEIYAPEFVGHWTGRPDTYGRDEFIAFVTDGRKRFPNWNETVEQIVAEGDLVVLPNNAFDTDGAETS